MSTTPRQPDQVIAQAMLAAAAEAPPPAMAAEEVAALEGVIVSFQQIDTVASGDAA